MTSRLVVDALEMAVKVRLPWLVGRVAGRAERLNREVSQEKMPMRASWPGALVAGGAG